MMWTYHAGMSNFIDITDIFTNMFYFFAEVNIFYWLKHIVSFYYFKVKNVII